MRGGFVGVDIFFVISGYLIGCIILRERREGRFSMARFYQRRIRRIIPAQVAMMLVTTVAASLILFPAAFQDYAASMIAAMLSVSNFYFWSQAGYFDTAAASKPLLHTWSLGVEEQFYLLFPPLVALLQRARLPLVPALCGVAIVSLALSIVAITAYPTATFYLLPTRAWELLLGVLCAELRTSHLRWRWLREALAVLGAMLVAIPILTYAAAMPFPGLAALPPCVGVAMLLVAGAHGDTLIGRVLSLKPIVFFGLISYSLYLWHWPVIVLTEQFLPSGWLRMPERAVALLVSIALAYLSWRYVERPFRSPRVTPRAIVRGTGVAALLVCGLGAGVVALRGLPERFPPQVVRMASYLAATAPPQQPCMIELYAPAGTLPAPQCLATDTTRPNVLIFGDSHAEHLFSGLAKRFPGLDFQRATAAGCRVTVAGAADETPTCRRFRRAMYQRYFLEQKPRWVLLAGFWGWDGLPQIGPTIDWFHAHGIRVVLAGPVPRYEVPLPLALALSELRKSDAPLARVRIQETAVVDRLVADIARRHGALYFSPSAALCKGATCTVIAPGGEPVQYDYGHLTAAGSYIVAAGFPATLVERSSIPTR